MHNAIGDSKICHIFLPVLFVRLYNENEANIFSSRVLLLSIKHSINRGAIIEHAARWRSLSPIEGRWLLIQQMVTRQARARLGMLFATDSDRTERSLVFPLARSDNAAFLCQFSLICSSSF